MHTWQSRAQSPHWAYERGFSSVPKGTCYVTSVSDQDDDMISPQTSSLVLLVFCDLTEPAVGYTASQECTGVITIMCQINLSRLFYDFGKVVHHSPTYKAQQASSHAGTEICVFV